MARSTGTPIRLNAEAIWPLYLAAKEFVRKCESGEARSEQSQAQMREAIAIAESTLVTEKEEKKRLYVG